MRKVILLVMVTLDGYFDAPGEGLEKIDWHHADEEWEDYSVEILSEADILLFGRKTYEGFASFWPSQEGEVAHLLNTINKVVFSTTLTEATWQGTRLVRDHVPEVIAQLKAQPSKPILVFGSADFAATLTQHGLIDEYRIAINRSCWARARLSSSRMRVAASSGCSAHASSNLASLSCAMLLRRMSHRVFIRSFQCVAPGNDMPYCTVFSGLRDVIVQYAERHLRLHKWQFESCLGREMPVRIDAFIPVISRISIVNWIVCHPGQASSQDLHKPLRMA
jgi:dihydrofolate reductase